MKGYMKYKVILVICLLLLVGVGLFTAREHSKEVVSSQAATQKKVNTANEQMKELEAANKALVAKYNTMLDQCNAGYSAYTLTTTAQRTANKLTMPTCGLPIVE